MTEKSPVLTTFINRAKVQAVTYSPANHTLCSIGKKPFGYVALIYFEPDKWLLEFESFEKYLESLQEQETTIEELTRTLFDKLVQVLGDIPIRINCQARTTVHAPAGAIIEQGDFKHEPQDSFYSNPSNWPVYRVPSGS